MGMPRRWMHGESCWLVDDGQVSILIHDNEGDRLWLWFYSLGGRDGEFHQGARMEPLGGSGGNSVDEYQPLFD
jgi:hypothetical protein